MNIVKSRLYEDEYNIELRYYYLIQLILDNNWSEILNILEETPSIHLSSIQFVFQYIPLTMINKIRIEKVKERLNSIEIIQNGKENSFENYRNERNSFSSSCSSLTSIESFQQTIRFLSKGKFYRKYFHWNSIGKGECEIIENNQSGEILIRFWILKSNSIKLVFLVNLDQSNNFYILSNKSSSSYIIKFQAKNQCDYPYTKKLILYKIKFNSIMDVKRMKDILTLNCKDMLSHVKYDS
ncbi:unnamed protein product [Adineta steineri]|uniref:Uncharacterized protein n=1 Tax=Adineta steineri TaxID=433720 RepID=A0A814FAM8_9BILA|nr:unnamed protein product [Adineta steineri]CAF3840634.1 unnamed protein product [Adineta steineri]